MTIEELSKLDDEELMRHLAQMLGWKDIQQHRGNYWTGTRPRQPEEDCDQYMMALPLYATDLNAVAGVEAGLKAFDKHLYADILCSVLKTSLINGARPKDSGAPHLSWHGVFQVASATARHKCIALVLTLQKP